MKGLYIVLALLISILAGSMHPSFVFASSHGANVCISIPADPEYSACVACVNANNAYTALGCIITTDQGEGLFTKLFTTGTGIAGVIAFIIILLGGFKILTSAGNPERLTEGKEMVSSAIAGLLMIIFSIFILQVIGVNVLCIPGFGSC